MCVYTCWSRRRLALILMHTKFKRTQVMLIPPREYVERWLVKPSRPYHR